MSEVNDYLWLKIKLSCNHTFLLRVPNPIEIGNTSYSSEVD